MAKKETTKAPTTHLKAEQYWEWRTTILEMDLAKEKAKSAELQWGQMSKDLEIARLKVAIYRNSVDSMKALSDKAKESYDEYLKRLEASTGRSMRNVSVQEDFEIVVLDEAPKEIS